MGTYYDPETWHGAKPPGRFYEQGERFFTYDEIRWQEDDSDLLADAIEGWLKCYP